MKMKKRDRLLISGILIILSLSLNKLYTGLSDLLMIAAAVTFLFMLGNYLESRTLQKTRTAIKALLDLAPDRASVLRDGMEIEVSPDEVIKGDEVFSGTIIKSGYLKIRADRVGEDTTFSRIVQMVEETQDKKAKTQKFLEIFSRYYTPSIIVLSVITFLVTRDLGLFLTLLVISCPGALVISTPVSIVAGIGNGAKNGVLIKGGEILEKLGNIKVLAFDKTGTLTIGKPKVTNIKAFGIGEDELLELTANVEMYSEHPLARAILEES